MGGDSETEQSYDPVLGAIQVLRKEPRGLMGPEHFQT